MSGLVYQKKHKKQRRFLPAKRRFLAAKRRFLPTGLFWCILKDVDMGIQPFRWHKIRHVWHHNSFAEPSVT